MVMPTQLINRTKQISRVSESVLILVEPQLNARTRAELTRSLQNIKAKKNLSRTFTNVKDAIKHLKNL